MNEPCRRWRSSQIEIGERPATHLEVGEALLAELRALRCDVRELIAVTRGGLPYRGTDPARVEPQVLPAMMTIAEAGKLLRTSTRAIYMRIRRGTMPGVVRIGSRRLMVKTDEFLRELQRAPTLG
jgi:hypothetical protein